MAVKIFFCYAHEDELYLNKLKAYLRPLQRQELIDVWYDRDISAGTEWEQEISQRLNEANIILLFVSPDFMNSDYCYSVEMKHALERHDRREAIVIPVIVRPIYWQGVLGTIQALPTDAKPLVDRSWYSLDEALYDIAEGIRKVVVQIGAQPVSPAEVLPAQALKGESADVSHLALMPPPVKSLFSLKPGIMNYLDFELEIGAGSGREYPVVVLHSAGGEARENMHFPFDELALESQMKDLQIALLRSGGTRRQILSPEEQKVQNFGRALFNALFTGEVRSRYEVSRLAAFHQGKGLRLKLRINSPEMAALPWEFLYDANEAEYVCLSSNTPIVRYIELPRPPQPLTVTLPLRILGMTASPQDLPELDVELEKQRVEIALKGLQTTGAIELTWLEGQSAYDLQRAMRGGPWHIFHFIGHGGFNARTDEGLIALVDEDGRTNSLSATHLGRLLADHRSLRLVVLNSCEGAKGSTRDIFSSTAAILVRRGIPAVLAMQYEITDRAAITLAKVFYEALVDGTPVDMAVSEARKTMSLAAGTTVEWGTPVLYMRSPDGVLFDLIKKLSRAQEPPGLPADVQTPSERRSAVLTVPQPQSLRESPLPAQPLPSLKSEAFSLLRTLTGHTGVVWSVAFSPDGHTLASSSGDDTIKLWNLARGEELQTFTGHTDDILCVAFSLDGHTVASGSYDHTIKLWNLTTGQEVQTLTGHTNTVNSVAFSPDGHTLASSSSDRKIKLWNLTTGQEVQTLTKHIDAVFSVAFSPDGQTLASGSWDKTIKLWNLTTGQEVQTLTGYSGHEGGVFSVAFSPDGPTLASSSSDHTIKLWNLTTGQEVQTLAGHTDIVRSVAFNPDGQTLASGSDDQTIKIWGKK